MNYYQLPDETYAESVIRTHATYAEAYACNHEITMRSEYCDRPDASGMDLLPNRMIIELFLMDVLLNQPRWTYVDVTFYNAEQLQDLIGTSNSTLKRYTPSHTGNYRERLEMMCCHAWEAIKAQVGRNRAMEIMLREPIWEKV